MAAVRGTPPGVPGCSLPGQPPCALLPLLLAWPGLQIKHETDPVTAFEVDVAVWGGFVPAGHLHGYGTGNSDFCGYYGTKSNDGMIGDSFEVDFVCAPRAERLRRRTINAPSAKPVARLPPPLALDPKRVGHCCKHSGAAHSAERSPPQTKPLPIWNRIYCLFSPPKQSYALSLEDLARCL